VPIAQSELQAEAAAAVAGQDPLVIIVGPAGVGKTTMLARAVDDLNANGRRVYAVAPTAKAARVLARETGAPADTVAKLIHEWTRPDRSACAPWDLRGGTTLLVDEAGMLNTGDLFTLARLAAMNEWRVALLGDPHQLHAVGRGGMFDELCAIGRVHELTQIHRFTERWEPDASLALRRGDPTAIDTYIAHGRVTGGTIDQHVAVITDRWMQAEVDGATLAITTATNDHVELINRAVQQRRVANGDLVDDRVVIGMNAQPVYVGDHIATRANDRHLRTSTGDIVRNRETWRVIDIASNGDVVVRRLRADDTVTLPADYVARHLQLGYATTEPGNQGDTYDRAITLVTPATTGRGLYVSMTRGRHDNTALVVTEEATIEAAADVLNHVISSDRADVPAIAQRRELAQQIPPTIREPQLQPRCEVPEWWNTLRTDVRLDIRDVEQSIDALHADQQRRAERLGVARVEAQRAAAGLDPYREQFAMVSERFQRAQGTHAAAEADVQNCGLRGRRATRTQLVVAAVEMHEARQDFDSINEIWQPLREAADVASQRHVALNQHHSHQDWLDDRRQLPVRLDGLQQELRALDVWRRWESGREVTIEALTATVAILEAIDDPAPQALADAVVRSTPELTARRESIERGIEPVGREVDLGVGL
jgi:DNA transposition AAA+ family ATPase